MYLKILLFSILCMIFAIYLEPVSIYSFFQTLIDSSGSKKSSSKLFTVEELRSYNGNDKPELYLAILGQVFDVSKGSKHYGAGQSYHFFIGRDGSRSFVTGQFNEHEVSDQVADLTLEELRSLDGWVKFYKKEYQRVGKLIGRYYQSNGKLTQYGKEVRKLIKGAEKAQQNKDLEKLKYPPCNIEWDPVKGSRVWCTNRSGGISRDWVGVPRQLYEPGSKSYRCACVNLAEEGANLKQYEGCDSESESCVVES